ncbi:PEP-CTERM sorting domain-containing protein [Massilia horti]|uniref:PEP-CTERM sorting domain-containing protein n=1 Tax=Massilia horti TaxID=2562153 RepID=A0A4Y9STK0_9BURK|nr:PEP-CTERM sorting domain-containing protein [Massilia horti]TFW30122.1 PEP-CTERM sorting domain-containing protein [Massilia horti]
MKNKKRILAGTVLLAASAFSRADPVTWQFEYSGLNGHTSSYLDQDTYYYTATLTGLIQGEDRNHDGVIDKSELVSLKIGNDGFSGNFASCDTGWGSSEHYCTLDRFMFAPNASSGPALEITGKWSETDEMHLVWNRMEIVTGERYEYSIYKNRSVGYAWNDQTTLRITQVSPVPEPAGGLMLAAGLVAAAALRRLRRS